MNRGPSSTPPQGDQQLGLGLTIDPVLPIAAGATPATVAKLLGSDAEEGFELDGDDEAAVLAEARAARREVRALRPDALVLKPLETVTMAPKLNRRLTHVHRQVWNVLLLHAQKQGDKNTFAIPLKQLLGDLRYTSRNVQFLKQRLTELIGTVVDWDRRERSTHAWQATSLLSWASIVSDANGATILWRYDKSLRRVLLAPEQYAKLPLELNATARTYAGLVLAELGVQYATSPNGLTQRKAWEWWVPVLTGNPAYDATEYKNFKRDVLKRGLAEVNAIQDRFRIALLEHKHGRKVTELQFRVSKPVGATGEGAGLQDNSPPPTANPLHPRLMGLGLSQPDTDAFLAAHSEEALEAAIAATKMRLADGAREKLKSVAAYFRGCLKRGSDRLAPAPKKTQRSSASVDPIAALRAEYARRQAVDARRMFEEMSAESRAAEVQRFLGSLSDIGSLGRLLSKVSPYSVLTDRKHGAVFFDWLAKSTWPEALSDSDLAAAAVRLGLLKLDARRSTGP